MSYSSKLITLRALVFQLRTLLDDLGIDPEMSALDFLQLKDALEQASLLKAKVEGKTLVLEITEDQEGTYQAYTLRLSDGGYVHTSSYSPEKSFSSFGTLSVWDANLDFGTSGRSREAM